MENETNTNMVYSMTKWHGGKGSKRRPEDSKKYEEAWEKIFGQPRTKEKTKHDKKKLDRTENNSIIDT